MTTGARATAPDISPELLTVEEAAIVARCSVRTVRRAYTNGVLMAYRRGGSRAVLLDPQDVQRWLQGELVQPSLARSGASAQRTQARIRTRRQVPRDATNSTQLRFDTSADALRARREMRGAEPNA